MATKLNPNAFQDKAIEEEKLSQEVQDKLNAGGGVEEAPIDGKPYVRQDAGWVGFDYPETEPEVREFTAVGTYTIQVPIGKRYCYAFIVNGGNSGDVHRGGRGTKYVGGGKGGLCKDILINVEPLKDIIITVGAGGKGVSGSYGEKGKKGEISSVVYNSINYNPGTQPENVSYGKSGDNGFLNPWNKTDTNLYGAEGGSDANETYRKGGKTGGGDGVSLESSAMYATFYGAGSGNAADGSTSGYRGYVYLKFT